MFEGKVIINGIEQARVAAPSEEQAKQMISSYGMQYLMDCKNGEKFEIVVGKI